MRGARSVNGSALDSAPGVAVAATLLVVATWAALTAAPPPGESTAAGSTPAVTTRYDSLPGFRADLFALPDDSLAGFVTIPGGPFVMGSHPGEDPLAFDIEMWGGGRAQGSPDVDTFLIGRFEVTRGQYRAFVAESGHPVVDPAAIRGAARLPVTHVAWTDAVAYTRWLDEALRASAATPPALRARLDQGWRVDLPTEAQWEKAARSTDGRIYPWGDTFEVGRANVRSTDVLPVGTIPCDDCAYGIADMAGNVWEWTRSPWQPYPFSNVDDLATRTTDALWVMRGGSFGDTEQLARGANRGGADPGARRPFIGFRVVLTAPY